MKIRVIGPIHVGDGKQLKKTEFLYDKQRNRVFVLDSMKMYAYLEKVKLLDRFQDYVLGMGKNTNLFPFLQNQNIPRESWESWKSYDYGISVRENTSLNEIHSFVKDANGNPYIPGSSIKGMIRTALLAYLLGNNKEGRDEEGMLSYRDIDKGKIQSIRRTVKQERIDGGKRGLRNEVGELEALTFHQLDLKAGNRVENQKNAVCSILRGLLGTR
jgi:CRISPR-associated RAMP protein, csm5 family